MLEIYTQTKNPKTAQVNRLVTNLHKVKGGKTSHSSYSNKLCTKWIIYAHIIITNATVSE